MEEQENILMKNVTVVFCDVVGFSRRDGDEQFQIISTLNQRVSQVLDKHLSYIGYNPNIIYLPTGDGMAVVFIAPSRFPKDLPFSLLDNLVEWIRKEKEKDKEAETQGIEKKGVELRIGVHHGAINLITVNRYPNVCGDTINACQRIMDAAHSNQVLISQKAFEKYREIIQGRYDYFPRSPEPLEITAKHNRKLDVRVLFQRSRNILTKDEPYPHGFIEGRAERTRFLRDRIQEINRLSKGELGKIHIYERAAFSTFWISSEAVDAQDDKDMTLEYKHLLLDQRQALSDLVEKAGGFKVILDPEDRKYSAKAMVGRYKALLHWMVPNLKNKKVDWVESKGKGPNRLMINPHFCFEGYKYAHTAGYDSSLIYYDKNKFEETITLFDNVFEKANEEEQNRMKQEVYNRFTLYMMRWERKMSKRGKGNA